MEDIDDGVKHRRIVEECGRWDTGRDGHAGD